MATVEVVVIWKEVAEVVVVISNDGGSRSGSGGGCSSLRPVGFFNTHDLQWFAASFENPASHFAPCPQGNLASTVEWMDWLGMSLWPPATLLA